MEKKWYQSSYYRTLLDMHIEDWDASFLSEFDPDYYVEQVKKAQIDAVMIYVQAHTGLCYWPTKSGVMHRSFLGHEDRIRRVFDISFSYRRICTSMGVGSTVNRFFPK